jgi:hypothetical protein
VTGTLGLVAIGLLVLTVSPRRHDSPIALSATTTPQASFNGSAQVVAAAAGGAQLEALATPIGDGDRALMTFVGLEPLPGAELDVQLTSGPIVTAVVDATRHGVVIVSITSGGKGHVIADQRPQPDEIVTVMADPPVTVAFSAVDSVDADEGTPVLDSEGQLVGLCTRHRGDTLNVVDIIDELSTDAPDAGATTVAP